MSLLDRNGLITSLNRLICTAKWWKFNVLLKCINFQGQEFQYNQTDILKLDEYMNLHQSIKEIVCAITMNFKQNV